MSYQRDNKPDPVDKQSEWSGCCAQLCPIQPSVSAGGNKYCTFHFGSEYADFDGITSAIKNNMSHYLYYRKVTLWNNEQWRHNLNNLRNYDLCPLQPHEEGLPCTYEQRLFKSIISKVKAESRGVM